MSKPAEPPQDVAGLIAEAQQFDSGCLCVGADCYHKKMVRNLAAALAAMARERDDFKEKWYQSNRDLRAAWKRAEQAERERDEAWSALRELVACKDLRDRQKAMAFVKITAETETMRMEYERRKPAAWAAARAALDAARGKGGGKP